MRASNAILVVVFAAAPALAAPLLYFVAFLAVMPQLTFDQR